jgi:hypothetical protein
MAFANSLHAADRTDAVPPPRLAYAALLAEHGAVANTDRCATGSRTRSYGPPRAKPSLR